MANGGQKAVGGAENRQHRAPEPFPYPPANAHLSEYTVKESAVSRPQQDGKPGDVKPVHAPYGHKGEAQQAGTRGKVHIGMPAEGYGFQILGHTVHIQAAVKQSFGQIAVIVVKNEFVIVQQEKE